MKVSNLLQAAVLPVTNMSVLLALITFWLLVSLAGAAGMMGLWLAIVIVPALFRYATNLVETMGRNRTPEPPGSEFFRWVGESWSLFPVVIVIALAIANRLLHDAGASTIMMLLNVVAGFLYPASLGVLAITHSPLQSINPMALTKFVQRVGFSYLIAPAFLLLIILFGSAARALPYLAEVLAEMYLVLSLHAVIGSIMAPHNIFEEVRIPDSLEQDERRVAQNLEKARSEVLTHAYGLVSRGNREGGFKHIVDCIAKDPDAVAAWAWFFDRMIHWQQQEHALFFAQHYIHDLLRHGEKIPALKLIMRCRLVNERFRPFPDDLPAAIAAAEGSANSELATVLKHP